MVNRIIVLYIRIDFRINNVVLILYTSEHSYTDYQNPPAYAPGLEIVKLGLTGLSKPGEVWRRVETRAFLAARSGRFLR